MFVVPKERKGDRWSEHTGVRRSKLDTHAFKQSQRLELELKKKKTTENPPQPITHYCWQIITGAIFLQRNQNLPLFYIWSMLWIYFLKRCIFIWCVWVLCFHSCKHIPCVAPMKARRVSDHGELELQVVVYCGILF